MNNGLHIGLHSNTVRSMKDVDAKIFIDAVQDSAKILVDCKKWLDIFYNDLKRQNVYDLLDVFYPIIGGTANSHLIEGKDPFGNKTGRNANITWNGTITHSRTGVKGNGSTGYGNLNYNPSTAGNKFTQNSAMFGVYSRTNSSGAFTEIGNNDGASNGNFLNIRDALNRLSIRVNSTSTAVVANMFNSQGLITNTRIASNQTRGWVNGKLFGSGTTVSSTISNNNMYVLARNNAGTAVTFSARECCFFCVGSGNVFQKELFDAVELLQFQLGRSVLT